MAEGFLLKSRVHHESVSPCKEDAGLMCNVLGLRNWDSDNERTPPPQAVPSLLSVSAAALRFLTVSTLRAEKAHPFAVVACYTAL